MVTTKGLKSNGISQKRRMYKFLHNPRTKWSHVYHSMVTSFILTYSFMLGFYMSFEEFKTIHDAKNANVSIPRGNRTISYVTTRTQPDYFIISIDCVLLVFFVIELTLRLWSASCIAAYSGLSGRLAYLKAFHVRRALDIMAIIVSLLTIIGQVGLFCQSYFEVLIILQILQGCQANRILFPYMRGIVRTIFGYQSQYLLFCVYLIIVMSALSSAIVFLAEYGTEETQFINIFESFWFIFETFTTIGFGDVVPKTWFCKFVCAILGMLGIIAFSLPANIIGTTLSIKMNQDPRESLKYRKAVRLIQTTWRCHMTEVAQHQSNHKNNEQLLWRAFTHFSTTNLTSHSNPSTPKWTIKDMHCISFILKTKYILARDRFKRKNINLSSYSDVSLQNAELWQRIAYIEEEFSLLTSANYNCLHEIDTLLTSTRKIREDILISISKKRNVNLNILL